MKTWLWVATALLAGLALAHSYLGERLILGPLFRPSERPRHFRSDRVVQRTLRSTWHLTSIAWLGLASVLGVLAVQGNPGSAVVLSVAATFVTTALVIALASRGRHPAWAIFLLVGLLAWLAR
jgi:hypothetical protein